MSHLCWSAACCEFADLLATLAANDWLHFKVGIPSRRTDPTSDRRFKQKEPVCSLSSGGSCGHSERNYTINDGDPPPHHPPSAGSQIGGSSGPRDLGWTEPSLGARTRNDHRAPLSSDLDDVELHGAGHYGPCASLVSLTSCHTWTCIPRSGNGNHVDC